jgi:hypothetical protein
MVIDPTKLLPPGQKGTPEGNVDNPGVPEGNLTVKQYNSLNKNIFAIQRNLTAIADLISGRNAQDAEEDKREIKQKRESADSLKKGTKENFIESALKNGLVKPIEALKKRAMGPFGRFMKALEALFLGWLGIKGLDALEAWSEGDNDAFEKIKNDLIKGLAIAGGVALALNGGIGAITGTISGVLTSMLLNIPKILGLLANPYLLIGAIAVAAGVTLFDIIKNDRFGSGRSSFSESKRKTIDHYLKHGRESTLEMLYEEEEKIYKQKPALRGTTTASPERIYLDPFGILNEIEHQRQQLIDGVYGNAIGENITDEDKVQLNHIIAAIKVLRQNTSRYETLNKDVGLALSKVQKDVSKLSPEDKRKYDEYEKLKTSMIKSMEFIQGIRDTKLTEQGKNFFNARVGMFDEAMFLDKPGILGIPRFGGEPDPNRLSDLNDIVQQMNKGLGKAETPPTSSAPAASTVAPPVQQMPQSNGPTNITPEQVAPIPPNFGFSLEPVSSRFNNVEGTVASVPLVVVQPVGSPSGDSGEPVSSTPSGTALPDIRTTNPNNEWINFARSVYEA